MAAQWRGLPDDGPHPFGWTPDEVDDFERENAPRRDEAGLPDVCQACDRIFREGEVRVVTRAGVYCRDCAPEGSVDG